MQLIMVLGYLGSGKTTFIQNTLQHFSAEKNAVIVNDFGAKDVDGVVLEKNSEVVKKIFDGSIFCSCKSDQFVSAMLDVIKQQPDNIIVEASGLANPYTMIRELDLIEQKGNVKLCTNIFCVVNASSFEQILSVCHAIKMQVALSDVILLNKTDLASDETVCRVKKLLGEITNAQIISTKNAKLDKYFGYDVPQKQLPKYIQDIVTQKLMLKVNDCTKVQLDDVCSKLCSICHRIKGVVKLDGSYYVYEYIDGQSKLQQTARQDSFLVLLSCLKSSLKQDTQNIIQNYEFLEIQ